MLKHVTFSGLLNHPDIRNSIKENLKAIEENIDSNDGHLADTICCKEMRMTLISKELDKLREIFAEQKR